MGVEDCWDGAVMYDVSVVDSRWWEPMGESGCSLDWVSRRERREKERCGGGGSGLDVIVAGRHGVEAVEKRRA
jgi:hypothetical protein